MHQTTIKLLIGRLELEITHLSRLLVVIGARLLVQPIDLILFLLNRVWLKLHQRKFSVLSLHQLFKFLFLVCIRGGA